MGSGGSDAGGGGGGGEVCNATVQPGDQQGYAWYTRSLKVIH